MYLKKVNECFSEQEQANSCKRDTRCKNLLSTFRISFVIYCAWNALRAVTDYVTADITAGEPFSCPRAGDYLSSTSALFNQEVHKHWPSSLRLMSSPLTQGRSRFSPRITFLTNRICRTFPLDSWPRDLARTHQSSARLVDENHSSLFI